MALSNIKTVWKPVKAHVEPVVAEICATRKIYFVWGKSSSSSGEHPKGLALDFSVLEYGKGVNQPGPARAALGNEIANYLWENRKRLNVWYVIWNRRIISTTRESEGWRPYTGKSPHTDHVHVSFEATGTYKPPPAPPKPDEDEVTPQDIDKIADRVIEKLIATKLDPGPFAERVGNWDEDDRLSFGGLIVGSNAWPKQVDEKVDALAARLNEIASKLHI